VATIFLDTDLRIRRFTAKATELVKLVPADIGRPITHFAMNLQDLDLEKNSEKVLRTLEKMEIEAQANDGRIFSVRIIPYRTVANVIDGVVITLGDISQRKKLEKRLRRSNLVCENLLDLVPEPYLLLDGELRVVAANQKFYNEFKTDEKTLVDEKFFESGKNKALMPEFKKKLLAFADRLEARTESFDVTDTFPGLGKKSLCCSVRRLAGDEEDGGDLILVLMEINEK